MLWVITLRSRRRSRLRCTAKGGKFKNVAGEGESMLSAIPAPQCARPPEAQTGSCETSAPSWRSPTPAANGATPDKPGQEHRALHGAVPTGDNCQVPVDLFSNGERHWDANEPPAGPCSASKSPDERPNEPSAPKLGGCLIADAIQVALPQTNRVTVEIAGRAIHLPTPPEAQHMLLSFDKGGSPKRKGD